MNEILCSSFWSHTDLNKYVVYDCFCYVEIDKSLLKIGLDASASLLQQFHEAFFVLDALLCLAADLLAQIGIQFLNQSDQCGLGLFAHLLLQVDHLLDA